MHRFYVTREQIKAQKTNILGQEARHMAQVLRLRIGDAVELVDDGGAVYEGTIEQMEGGCITLSVGAVRHTHRESPIRITLAQALLKDRKMDTLIRQLTELGIARWMPFAAERSVPRPDDNRLKKRVARWEKIALAALKQSRRNHPPLIQPSPSFKAVLGEALPSELKVIFCEKARQLLLRTNDTSGGLKSVFVLVGPEGGFTAKEIAEAVSQGFTSASLGPRILRAETATVAASALIQYLYGDLGLPEKE